MRHPGPIVILFAALLGVIGLCAAAPARAIESAPTTTSHAVATLLTDRDSHAPGQELRLALRLRLKPGWHTYWKNPGDAGAPPTLDLALPAGLTAGPLEFPAPIRMVEGPLVTYGYTGDVILPLTITGDTGPIALSATAAWLACKDICVPEEARFTLAIPAGTGAPGKQAGLFTDLALPRPSPFPAHIGPDGMLTLDGAGLSAATVQSAEFFPDATDAIVNAAPQTLTMRDGRISLQLTLVEGAKIGPLSGVLVLRDGGGQQSALQFAAQPGPPAKQPTGSWAAMLGAAFLGGLILNLMPCVFPILAMKTIGLAHLSGQARAQVRSHALSYTAGILLTFTALGGTLILLRRAGSAAGWGFQFQSPAFVAAIAWVLFGVGLLLSGVVTLGGALAGSGQALARREGHLGSFFTGLLAVLVATPCTAPFMGAAIAAAVLAPPVVTLLVFLVLGAGLAAPTLLLAAIPRLADALPRPGRWMDLLKQGLAFPMYGAAAWLVWVEAQSAGPGGVLATLSGLVLIGFAAWAFAAGAGGTIKGRRLGNAASLCAVLIAIAILAELAVRPPPAGASLAADESAEPYTAARLAALRDAGSPVFVNMTAAWCVTCMVNERVALDRPEVREAFARSHVAYLLGDWTRQDPAITEFLRDHQRDGVPLYVLFPPGAQAPILLPQILTESDILAALTRAGV